VFDFLGRKFVEKETRTQLVFGVVFTIFFTVALSTNLHGRKVSYGKLLTPNIKTGHKIPVIHKISVIHSKIKLNKH